MRTVGVREARQKFSALLDEVRKGRRKAVPNLASFRRKMPILSPPLSVTVAESRADRF
jgi:hypothetical protein